MTEITIIADDGSSVEYTIDISGQSINRVADELAADPDDSVIDNGDGTYTIDGHTSGVGIGDTYLVSGQIIDATINTPLEERAAFRVYINGEDRTNEILPNEQPSDTPDVPDEPDEPESRQFRFSGVSWNSVRFN